MANANEIKSRIQSVQDTSKITNAMYLISSTKLQRAKKSLERTKPYFEAVMREIDEVFAGADNPQSRYFARKNSDASDNAKTACLIITADKGLAGSYNMNVIKKAEEILKKYPETKFYVVGNYARHYFDRHGIEYSNSFDYNAMVPHIREARNISDVLIEDYDSGETETVFVIYTEMKTALSSEVMVTRILPFEKDDFVKDRQREDKPVTRFEFYPSADEVLDNALRSIMAGFIYSALVYSFCAEQNARMSAMDSANKNAENLLDELKLKYNRVRQADITQEITEIAAGELAQKRKHLKEKGAGKEVQTS